MSLSTEPRLAALRRTPANLLVRSRAGRLGDLCGFAIARAVDAHPVVLEILEGGDRPAPDAIPWTDLVGEAQHFLVRAPDGGPGAPLWPIARASAPDHPLASLTEFLTAPEMASRLFGRYLPPVRPLPILIANGAPAARFFPDDPLATTRLLELQKHRGFLTVFVTDETVRRDLVAFDFAFEVVPDPEGWEATRLRVVRAPWDHDLRRGDELRLGEIGAFRAALEGIRRSPAEWAQPAGVQPSA